MSEPEGDLAADRFGPTAFELFKDVFGEWRWRLRAGSRVMAMAAESYPDRSTCLDRVRWVRAHAGLIDIEGKRDEDAGPDGS